ncbi:MAG: ATP synthase delta/epsilon chain alpha-helix domain-containing protein, partial [Rickettsiella sp.]|nr:ATP synthase delta/epsilon chain alpha-helix domain-containing protein [Rickettsiella sp.]
AALEDKQRAEHVLSDKQANIDYAKAMAELAQAVGQLQAIAKLKKKATGKR